MPLADRIVIVQNSRAWGRLTRHATPLELAEIGRRNGLVGNSYRLVAFGLPITALHPVRGRLPSEGS